MTQGQRRSRSLQIHLSSLSHFCPPENVLFPLVFALAHVRLRQVSSFLLLSLLLSSTHPFRPRKFLAAPLLIRFFLSGSHCLDWESLSQLRSGRFFFLGSYVKVLSVASWNYLGAKLIALDPTSHCNRLSANLGFSRCGQVSPWRWLRRAVCSAQGSDLCHTPPSSLLSHAIFVLSVAAKFVRTLFISEHLPTLPGIWNIKETICSSHFINTFFTFSVSRVLFPVPLSCTVDFSPRVLCFPSSLLFCLALCDVIDHLPQWGGATRPKTSVFKCFCCAFPDLNRDCIQNASLHNRLTTKL